MKTSTVIILSIMAMALFVWVGDIALNKNAKVECLQWQAQAEEFSQFYIVQWQKEQCDSVGIFVGAPVK